METPNDRLRKVRSELGLSQAQLAEALDMKQGSLSDTERAKGGLNVSHGIKLKLYKKYNINIDYIENGNLPIFKDEIKEPKEPYVRLTEIHKKIISFAFLNHEEEVKNIPIVKKVIETERLNAENRIMREMRGLKE